jgi:hypothetical protein
MHTKDLEGQRKHERRRAELAQLDDLPAPLAGNEAAHVRDHEVGRVDADDADDATDEEAVADPPANSATKICRFFFFLRRYLSP